MKKVLIYAYTKLNLGDDLFIKILCNRYPNVKFYIFTIYQYSKSFNKIQNLTCYCVDRFYIRWINNIFKNLRISKDIFKKYITLKVDSSVYIGGSIFMQLNDKWEYMINNDMKMKINNKPHFILGSNFGPYKNEKFFERYKEFFKECRDVCFRDKYSYELFKDLNNVRYASDIVFQGNKIYKPTTKSNNIVISVIKPSIRDRFKDYDEKYYDKISEVIEYFVKRGLNVILMSFCKFEGDEEAVEKIYNRIKSEDKLKVDKYFYRGDIKESLKIIGESRYVIATRFHAMILGLVYNKPVYPIIYSEKMTNVLNDINFNGNIMELQLIEELKVECVNESLKSLEDEIRDIRIQIKDSEKHFKILDKCLSK